MRFHFTLSEPFALDDERTLGWFLDNQEIVYHASAAYVRDLVKYGYRNSTEIEKNAFVKTYVVLIEEHELSAIMLTLNHVTVIQNSPFIEKKNKFRKIFSWFFS